jgi:hypothetical protein
MNTATTVVIGDTTYGYDAEGLLMWVRVGAEPIPIAGGKPQPEVPPECWHQQTEWDAERGHAATQAACRGQR